MSDSPLGPEWWMASDGRWYPPESQSVRIPTPPPPPPPPPPGEYRVGAGWWLASDGRWYPPTGIQTIQSPTGTIEAVVPSADSVSRGLSGTLQGFFWAAGGFSVLTAVFGLAGLEAFNRYSNTRVGSAAQRSAADDVQIADDTINSLLGFGVLIALVIFILIIIFGNQAHRVTRQLWLDDRSWTSGWTIGGWFIPVANAVIPKLVLSEIEKIATAPRSNGQASPEWKQQSASALGWIWWIFFVISYALATAGFVMFDDAGGSPGSWRTGYVLVAVGGAGLAVSSVTGALFIRKLTRALR